MTNSMRLWAIDAVRGAAIAGVVFFHFVWDLEFTGFIAGIANHPLWLAFGRSLAGTFMILVGVGLVLADRAGFRPSSYFIRLAKIAASAAAITVVTWYVLPGTFIYFGILHAIAAATLIGTLFLRARAWTCLLGGIAVFSMPMLWRSTIFDTRWLAWIGFAEQVPPSNDFVPIFPWVGLTLMGVAVAKWLLSADLNTSFANLLAAGKPARLLVWMGRHSLAIYLLHQPILLGIIVPLSWLAQR